MPKNDLIIAAITILTSSHFIYNSQETIVDRELSKLIKYLKLAGQLKGKSGEALPDQDYKELMPHLTWVLRDLNQNLTDTKLNKISSEEYLK